MTDCPCDDVPKRVLRIPAALPALPRQTQAFPEVRLALLALVANSPKLDGWRARGERDFGVMWLEMWAYVADVLGFYDERIANESYLRTAVRRPSLRRIIEIIGYVPPPGVAGSATVAIIADGRTSVSLPTNVGFRSDAFGNEAPQVFETVGPASVHPLTNSWEIGPLPPTGYESDFDPATVGPFAHGEILISLDELVFETANFGLAKDRLILITQLNLDAAVARVKDVKPFEGKDGRTYVKAKLDRFVELSLLEGFDTIQIQTPTVTAVLSKLAADPIDPGGTIIKLDSVYRQLREEDFIISNHGTDASLAITTAELVEEITEVVPPPPILEPPPESPPTPNVVIPLTKVTLEDSIDDENPARYTFHFTFVSGGRLTRVADTEITEAKLRANVGVPITGIVETPPAAEEGVLSRKFLLRDADNQGALVDGLITFAEDGTARFQATSDGLPETMKTPITVFGNVVETTRGESVFNEVLGNGDARVAHQTFKLKKKPLTYTLDPSVQGTHARSTLKVSVDGIFWEEVRSFFGRGPEDQVYITRPDDEGNTFITFGDGVRGARLPSGIKNVIANYRFGSGEAAPPANAIKQLARAVKGLRRVESPIAAVIGKDPNPPSTLRTSAPLSALTFGRAVSVADFEAFANLVAGVIKAVAEFLWIEAQQEAGVVITYIGPALPEKVLEAMRKEGEPGLALDARPAEIWESTFDVEVEVDPRFNPDDVARAVHAALNDPETGPLAQRNAPIGRILSRSVIFDVIHDVPGVVAIKSAIVTRLPPGSDVPFITNFKLAESVGVCASANGYLEFFDGETVEVTATTTTTPVLGAEAGA